MGWKDAPVENVTSKPAWDSAPLADEQPIETVPQRTLPQQLARQAGLTARIGIEGLSDLGGMAVNAASKLGDITPMGLMMNAAGERFIPNYAENKQAANAAVSGGGTRVSDILGLPKPETPTERVVNEAGRAMVPAGGVIKGANIAANTATSLAKQRIARFLAAAPAQQLAGAAGAGLGSSTAREMGAGEGGQLAAGIAGGLGAAAGASAINKAFNTASIGMHSPDLAGRQLEAVSKIEQAGINTANMADDVKSALVNDVTEALKISPTLDKNALKRLADYRTAGLTPMSGNLTLNPATITRERNLAKIGANSTDQAAQRIANLQRENDLKLMQGVGAFGSEDDAISASNKIINALNVKDEAAKKVIGKFYEQARNTEGRSALLNPREFTQNANNALDDALLGGKLPSDVRNKLNAIAKGDIPLTVDVAEQFKTNIGTLQRSSNDAAERLALGKVREALDSAPLIGGQGKQAVDAFNKARSVNREYMKMVERNPALQAVRDGVEPDKFVNKFIIGSGDKANISQVQALKESLKDNPEATTAIRGQIANFLKERAVNGKADEIANFSPDAYNKALKSIGDEKLKMFFSPQDVDMLKTLGRVSSYEKFQPTGSAVNNSNTAGALTSVLDKLANSPLVRKIPYGAKLISEPAQDISMSVNAKNATNARKAITIAQPKQKTLTAPPSILYGLGTVDEGND